MDLTRGEIEFGAAEPAAAGMSASPRLAALAVARDASPRRA